MAVVSVSWGMVMCVLFMVTGSDSAVGPPMITSERFKKDAPGFINVLRCRMANTPVWLMQPPPRVVMAPASPVSMPFAGLFVPGRK